MEQIALIIGPLQVYWSSIIRMLAAAAAVFLFWSLYLKKGQKPFAAAIVIPMAAAASLLLSRLAHWYFRPEAYGSLAEAVNLLYPGEFVLMGAFSGCFLAAVLVRILGITDNLPQLLDCMCLAGCAGIGLGRLASFFNVSNRGMIVMFDLGLPWVCDVVNPVSGATEYRLATFLLQAMAAGTLWLGLTLWYLPGRKHSKYRDGDAALLFLLFYGASQVVLDSTRYDSLHFHSNGFIRVTQVLGAGAVALAVVIFAGRLVYAQGWKSRQLLLFIPQAGCLALAGYMEYHVQRHGNEAIFAYSTMSGALAVILLLTLLTRYLGMRAEIKRRQELFQIGEETQWK